MNDYTPANRSRQVRTSDKVYNSEVRVNGLGFAFLAPIISSAGGVVSGLLARKRVTAQQKTASSRFADQAEAGMVANLRMWEESGKTKEDYDAAVANFYYWWNGFVQEAQQLGEPGQRGIMERQRGGKNSWGPDWFMLYLDPIVLPATTPSTGVATSTVTTQVPADLKGPLLLVGALLGLYLLTGSTGSKEKS